MIPKELIEYIESEIIPRYDSFDAAHRQDHAQTVISQSMALAEQVETLDKRCLGERIGEVVDEGSKLTFTTQPQMPFVIANKILKSGAVDIAFEDIERATNRSFTTVVVKAGDLYDHTNIVVYK